jgi:hypothetical protein
LKEEVLSGFGEKLEQRGFARKKRDPQTFYRAIAGGWHAVHLAFVDHRVDFDIAVDIAIRFDRVEELVNERNQLLSKAEQQRTATMGCELGNLTYGRGMRWTVATEADVQTVVRSIEEMVTTVALSYFDRFNSFEAALEVLSRDDREASMHSPIDVARAKRAVALAFLLKDPSRFRDVVSKKRKVLEDRGDAGAVAFLRFSEALGARLSASLQ